jgi:hypothetical protein
LCEHCLSIEINLSESVIQIPSSIPCINLFRTSVPVDTSHFDLDHQSGSSTSAMATSENNSPMTPEQFQALQQSAPTAAPQVTVEQLQQQHQHEVQVLMAQFQNLNAQFQQLLATQAPPLQNPPGPANHAREPKLRLPEPFDGTRGKYRSFINQCRLVWTVNTDRYTTDQSKCALVLSLLTGAAAQWAAPIMEDLDQLQDLSRFLGLLTSSFDDPDRARTASVSIRNLKEGRRPCSVYTSEFRRLATDLDWNPSAFIDAYHQGLSDDVKDRLSFATELPDSLDAYVDLAIRLDQRCHERAMERTRQPTRSTTTPQPRAASKPSEGASGSGVSAPMEIDNSRRGPLTPEEREHRRSNNLCFYCAAPGHGINNCPLKGRPRRAVNAVMVPPSQPKHVTFFDEEPGESSSAGNDEA